MAQAAGRSMWSRIGWVSGILWTGVLAILLLPLIAMRFTTEVHWTGADFAFVGAGLVYEVISRRLARPLHKVLAGGGIATVALAIWAQAAVGIV